MVFDAHSDIWSDVTVRSLRGETDIFRKYHYERLRKGNVEGSVFVMWIDPPYDKEPDKRLLEIMEAVRKEISNSQDILRIVHDVEEMQEARKQNIFYAFIGCEGISGIGEDIERIDELFAFGVRHISLTWNEQNAFAGGARADVDSGLTDLGLKALRKIQQMPILFDVSHLNDKSFWDVMKNTGGPVVATHSNSRRLCNVPRNLTDEMIKELAKTGGMIGVNAYPDFIASDRKERNVDMLVEHIGHIADIVGIEHVGFGFDFCEFLEEDAAASCSMEEDMLASCSMEKESFASCSMEKDMLASCSMEKESFASHSIEEEPGTDVSRTQSIGSVGICGLRDAAEIPNVLRAMRQAGFSQDDIRKVSYENWHKTIQKIMRKNEKI